VRNVIKGAGLGVSLRWASNNIIDNNEFIDILEDAVHIYRSDNNLISNNRITSAAGGVSLLTSDNNNVYGNVILEPERGFFLYNSSYNIITKNEVWDAYINITLADSANNKIYRNNFAGQKAQSYDEGNFNIWEGNYWGDKVKVPYRIPPNGYDYYPSASLLHISSTAATWTFPISPGENPGFSRYLKVRNIQLSITNQVTWANKEITLEGGISIEGGGSLTLDNVILIFAPKGMVEDIWIHVKPGGSLFIYGSKIIGPERDHSLSIKVYKDSTFVMKNSELHNAGSWVGTHCAALGIESDGAVIENNIFIGTYCAISIESLASNIRIINNTILNSIKGICIIGISRNTIISENKISKTACYGIQVWSIESNTNSIITNNRISDAWGTGIYDAWGDSFLIKDNDFFNIRGPGIFLLHRYSGVDGRQARPLSLSNSNVKIGDIIEVSIKLGNIIFWDPSELRARIFDVILQVNDKIIDRKMVILDIGQFERITLKGVAKEEGQLSIIIEPGNF